MDRHDVQAPHRVATPRRGATPGARRAAQTPITLYGTRPYCRTTGRRHVQKYTLTHATVRARPSHRAKPRSSRSELAQRWQASAASTRARPSPTGAPRARAIANPEAQPTERSHGRPLMCKPGTSGFIPRPMRACTVWLRASASTPRRSRQSESATRVCGLPIGAVDRSSPSSARDAWWREGGGSPETTGFNVDALSCGSGSAVFV